MSSLANIFWDLYFLWVGNLLSWFVQLSEHGQDYGRSAYSAVKRRLVHVLKAAALLATISFAGASLYYAKVSADYARIQLQITKLQYCESYTNGDRPCEEILKEGMA